MGLPLRAELQTLCMASIDDVVHSMHGRASKSQASVGGNVALKPLASDSVSLICLI